MVAEADPTMCARLEDLLDGLGYPTVRASAADEALILIALMQPTLLLLGLSLGIDECRALLDALAQQEAAPNVVLLSPRTEVFVLGAQYGLRVVHMPHDLARLADHVLSARTDPRRPRPRAS